MTRLVRAGVRGTADAVIAVCVRGAATWLRDVLAYVALATISRTWILILTIQSRLTAVGDWGVGACVVATGILGTRVLVFTVGVIDTAIGYRCRLAGVVDACILSASVSIVALVVGRTTRGKRHVVTGLGGEVAQVFRAYIPVIAFRIQITTSGNRCVLAGIVYTLVGGAIGDVHALGIILTALKNGSCAAYAIQACIGCAGITVLTVGVTDAAARCSNVLTDVASTQVSGTRIAVIT